MTEMASTATTPGGLAYETAGSQAPALVFVHAGICDRTQWDKPFRVFSNSHQAVRYDARGFGRSPDPERDYFDHLDLIEVLDTIGIERAVLIGASNGGRIVLDTAVAEPARTEALVLSGSALVGLPTGGRLRRIFEEEESALDSGDLRTAAEVNLRTWVDGLDRARGAPAVRARVAGYLEALLPRQAAVTAGEVQLVEPLVRDRLGDIKVPVLVLVGEHDQPEMHRNAGFLAAGIPDSRLEVVDDAAHLPDLEQPETFLRLLNEFLAALAPGDAPAS